MSIIDSVIFIFKTFQVTLGHWMSKYGFKVTWGHWMSKYGNILKGTVEQNYFTTYPQYNFEHYMLYNVDHGDH